MSTSNDNYAVHKVSVTRARQACGPCRRKKARCPGEKPTCSLCQRLGQRCTYGPQSGQRRAGRSRAVSNDGQEHRLGETNQTGIADSDRFQLLEDKLDKMTRILRESLSKIDTLSELSGVNTRSRHPSKEVDAYGDPAVFHTQSEGHSISSWPQLPTDVIESEVETYLSYFHDQPYCVFSKKRLKDRAPSLPPEIAFPLVALTCRLSRRLHENAAGGMVAMKDYVTTAWDILSTQYKNWKLGLSFLQGTFLMAQVDLADGRLQRGYAAIGLGLRILQSEGLNKYHNVRSLSNYEVEDRLRITWAFFMLDRTYNASRDYSLCLSDKHFTLHFPSPDTPEGHTEQESRVRGTLYCAPAKQGHKVDHGILACLLRLYSIWGKAAEYVFEPSNKDALSPWQTGSELAAVESDLLEFETHFADMHRFINVDFSRRAREEPQSRAYLSTWLCVQLLFHSIHCLLHHPFVVMIKVRQMDRNTPATFLQKSFENSVLHSRWIARIIREMSEVGFRLYDPFFGYLSAIAATIQLEYTVSKNEQVALIVNKDFTSLIDFMAGLAVHWDNMRVLVSRVNELASRHKNYRSLYYNGDGYSGALSSMPTPSNIPRMSAEDETLMWNILDLSSSSSGTEITNTVDTSPSQGQGMVTPDVHIPEQPILPTMPEETYALSGNQRIPIFQGVQSQDTPLFYGHNQGSIGQEPVSEWSFTNRSSTDQLGTAMPDIPDWLIVGEYMEYL